MATRGRGRARIRESRNEQPANNHVEFMVAMTNLANAMEENATATLQVVQRLARPAGSGNENGEGAEYSLSGVPRTLAAFLKANPLAFNGSIAPADADNGFQAVERVLQTQHVPYDKFMEYVTYQLLGEAQRWWQREHQLLHQQNGNVEITWALFQEACYKKYLRESMREARELELLQLKQESMTIAEYTSKFEELCKFSRISQGTPESNKGLKCVKYEVGLRGDIRRAMAPLETRRFSELVDNARVVEEYARTVASSRDSHGGDSSRERDDYLGPRGQNFKRDGHTPQHLQGQGNFRKDNKKAQFHLAKRDGRCYTCGKPGHISKYCRCRRNQDEGQSQQSGCVCTLDTRDATGSDPPTRGKRML
ncbi:uncharacterized protein LOC107627214 [Arachis ipaensis]|uniref:uncharacterized protein LOC107627214 n=1 Tax=Arachis ipaensis TaxID=130454 RepID=UPI0007AFC4E2|nr:uncharacterized protein LOC107627214 [Arachis ipaensis]